MHLWSEPTAFREVSMLWSFHLTMYRIMSKSSVCEHRAALCTVVTGETAVVMQVQKRCLQTEPHILARNQRCKQLFLI